MTETLPTRNSTRIIQGVILRCVDGHWSDRDGLTPPAELLAMGTTTALQCWQDGTPTDTVVERPGKPLPDVNELNAQIPEAEWEEGIDGKPRPPWVMQFVVYLIDPAHRRNLYLHQLDDGRADRRSSGWRISLSGCEHCAATSCRSSSSTAARCRRSLAKRCGRNSPCSNGASLVASGDAEQNSRKLSKLAGAGRAARPVRTEDGRKPATKKKSTVGKPVKPADDSRKRSTTDLPDSPEISFTRTRGA